MFLEFVPNNDECSIVELSILKLLFSYIQKDGVINPICQLKFSNEVRY